MRRPTSLTLALLGGGVAFAGMATELSTHARRGACEVQHKQDPLKPCDPTDPGSGGYTGGSHGGGWHGGSSSSGSSSTASTSARGGFGGSASAHGGGE